MDDSRKKQAKELFHSGSYIPVDLAVDDVDTVIKRRNRLAQRKHRQSRSCPNGISSYFSLWSCIANVKGYSETFSKY